MKTSVVTKSVMKFSFKKRLSSVLVALQCAYFQSVSDEVTDGRVKKINISNGRSQVG